MAGPIFPMLGPLVAAIKSFRGGHRARFFVSLWAAGLMSVSLPFTTEAQALETVDAPIGCVGFAAVNPSVAPPSDERDSAHIAGPLAYATSGDDVVPRTENAITINDARPFAAPTQIRLHRFLQPYEVINQVDRHPIQSRVKEAAPNRRQPAKFAPPPKDISVTGTTRTTFVALPPVSTSVRQPLNPAAADPAQLAKRVAVKGPNPESSAAEVTSIDLASDPSALRQGNSMTASQNVSPEALSVIAGALAGAAFGLFLISWLEIGRNFQVR